MSCRKPKSEIWSQMESIHNEDNQETGLSLLKE